jgi:hypothetical protein
MLIVLGRKAFHLAGLWVWSSSWGALRVRLPYTYFKQILNQNWTKFSVVYFAITGKQ